MADFGIGNPELQNLLEWVDQTPPAQARDTHALFFRLDKLAPPSVGVDFRFGYEGLMFFRPIQLGLGPVGSTLGLNGFGHLHALQPVPKPIPPDGRGAMWVRVFLGFRPRAGGGPAHAFATLQFLKRVNDQSPAGQIVEFSQVNHLGETIKMDVPPSEDDGWRLILDKATVLFKFGG
jgi:hypothetical protein